MTRGLEVRGLVKRFGGRVVLDDVSFAVPAGSLTCVLGPSGSGKSTILGIVAGLVAADGGAVLVDDADLTAVPAHRRPVTLVLQQPQLFGFLSLEDNVAFGLRVRGVPRRERRRRARELLELVGLHLAAERRPDGLSGGEQQRLALARALAVAPAVLLLDEPLASLDPPVRRGLQDVLVDVQRASGTTMVLVTHDRDEALALADALVVVDAGRVAATGAPRELYERPPSVPVARLLGIEAVLPGEAFGRAGPVVVRPEHVALAAPDAGLPGVVRAVRYGGALTEVRVATAVGVVVALVPTSGAPSTGASVGVVVPPEHVVPVAP